jgi:hypothetical protein
LLIGDDGWQGTNVEGDHRVGAGVGLNASIGLIVLAEGASMYSVLFANFRPI